LKANAVTSILEEMNKIGRSDDVSGIPYIELLGEIGPPARSALPVLKTFLQPQRWVRLRRTVAIAIRKIDPEEYARLGLPGHWCFLSSRTLRRLRHGSS